MIIAACVRKHSDDGAVDVLTSSQPLAMLVEPSESFNAYGDDRYDHTFLEDHDPRVVDETVDRRAAPTKES